MRTICLLISMVLVWAACGECSAADAIRRLKQLGVELEYDEQGSVIAADFGFEPLAIGADLALLAGFEKLSTLDIYAVDLGAAGFKHLTAIKSLKVLSAADTNCVDGDVELLSDLPLLEEIDLSGTAVTDASIDVLTQIPTLRRIDVSSTRITPTGLRRLERELPEVRLAETWQVLVGVVNGRRLLNMDRATIFFDLKGNAGLFGGNGLGGGSVQVSGLEDDDLFSGSSGGGGGTLGSALSASWEYIDGVPTILAGGHKIEIKDKGKTIVVDDKSFPVESEKLRIVLTDKGPKKLDD